MVRKIDFLKICVNVLLKNMNPRIEIYFLLAFLRVDFLYFLKISGVTISVFQATISVFQAFILDDFFEICVNVLLKKLNIYFVP